jgi:hypothetical protein
MDGQGCVVIGVGVDLTEVDRVAESLARWQVWLLQ